MGSRRTAAAASAGDHRTRRGGNWTGTAGSRSSRLKLRVSDRFAGARYWGCPCRSNRTLALPHFVIPPRVTAVGATTSPAPGRVGVGGLKRWLGGTKRSRGAARTWPDFRKFPDDSRPWAPGGSGLRSTEPSRGEARWECGGWECGGWECAGPWRREPAVESEGGRCPPGARQSESVATRADPHGACAGDAASAGAAGPATVLGVRDGRGHGGDRPACLA